MANYVYVDCDAVAIGGAQVAAVREGLVPNANAARERGLAVPFGVEYGRLCVLVAGDSGGIGRVTFYGSAPADNDTLWSVARTGGLDPVVVVGDPATGGGAGRGGLVERMTADITQAIYTSLTSGADEITLVAGDAGLMAVAAMAKRRTLPLRLAFWSHVPAELRDAATTFFNLDPYFEHLR